MTPFNEGADARLCGIPLNMNPHAFRSQDSAGGQGARAEWAMGWRDCNDMWGRDAWWPVRALPPVRETLDSVRREMGVA